MKGKLLLLTATLFIFSCNQKPKEQQEKEQPKVVTEAEKRDLEIQDSIKQVKIDSLALIAWGDAKFGMNMKQALATETFKNGNRFDDWLTMNYDRDQILSAALGLKDMSSFRAIFKQNKLTRIWIQSYGKTANEIEILLRDCDIFIKNFKEKYGEPSFIKDKVNISEFDNTNEIEYAKFQIGTKTITILLTHDSSNYTYRYNIYIDNSQFPKKTPASIEKEKREREKYVKEMKEVKENSF